MTCWTVDEAWQAGWDAPCAHGVPDPNDCPRCELTDLEVARLAVLHRPYLLEDVPTKTAAA